MIAEIVCVVLGGTALLACAFFPALIKQTPELLAEEGINLNRSYEMVS